MKTNHSYLLAIDLGKEVSVALLGERTGRVINSPWKFSHCLEDYQQLIRGLDPKQTLVGFEATGHYWLPLYDFLARKGFERAKARF
ncbi:MAG: transposase [Patescibacteria group bacterium]|nr:transposase [Patescibacteria group bacterium]